VAWLLTDAHHAAVRHDAPSVRLWIGANETKEWLNNLQLRATRAAVTRIAVSAALIVALGASIAPHAQSSLPDPQRTPGALNPEVTQETIQTTICIRGWTLEERPPSRYTSTVKRRQMLEYGYTDQDPNDYEEDHLLISLGLGGDPWDLRNLWPEPRFPADGWTAAMKNQLEKVLPRLVCAGELTLAQAQHAIATDWHAAYSGTCDRANEVRSGFPSFAKPGSGCVPIRYYR